MLNKKVKLFGLSTLVEYLQPKLPNIKIETVLYKYITYNRIERLYLEGGGDSERLEIVKIIQKDFKCNNDMFILIDTGY